VIPSLPTSISLLDGALGYTRDRLLGVTAERLGDPTPCAGWDLHDLLVHMDDSLDAFLEGAGGEVALRPRPVDATAADLCTRLQVKACALADVWRVAERDGRHVVQVAGHQVPAVLLVNTAALEITVHGWDVGQATGRRTRIPDDLAEGLLAVAQHVIDPVDRGPRFASPRPARPEAAPDVRLLSWTGRAPAHMTEPVGQ